MRHGFIKVGAASVDVAVANPEKNKQAIVETIKRAHEKGVRLLALPELCVTGYTCGDLFFLDALTTAAEAALAFIAEETKEMDIVFAVGLPIRHGSKLFNVAAVCHRGKVLGLVPKRSIPNYNEYYEVRHFTSADALPSKQTHLLFGKEQVPFSTDLIFAAGNCANYKFAVEICEDLWAPEPPCTKLCQSGAIIMLNLSASDEVIGKEGYRKTLVSATSARLVCGYAYANAAPTESTQDMVFSAHNLIAENGAILAENKPFEGRYLITMDIDVDRLASERRKMTTYTEYPTDYVVFSQAVAETMLERRFDKDPFVPSDQEKIKERCELIFKIQAHGLRKRIMHTRVKKIVVGVSGGLDSTLALLVMVHATDLLKRDRKDIIAISMPCFGTTSRTKSNAQKLCELFGVDYREIDITRSVRQHFEDIGQSESRYDIAYENGQARERTQVLMDVANMEGGLVVGTGDLSELALGWCTYNGDHMSMYGVNASVPKTLVRFIVHNEAAQALKSGNKALADVLFDILDTPVSPELLPPNGDEIQQKTESIIGPYELHDFFLYYTMRFGFPAEKIYRIACLTFEGVYDRDTIANWLNVFYRRFFSQQFKRSCMPDSVKVGTVTLSPRGDWRMPSDAEPDVFLTL